MERSRYSKRRRVDANEPSSRSDSGSPDELAESPPHPSRNGSLGRSIPSEIRARSFPNSVSDEDSPDELGNATPIYPELESEEYDRSGRESPQRSSRSSTATPGDTPADTPADTPPDTPRDTTPVPLPRKIQYAPYAEKLVLRGHRRGVASVRFSPDGRTVASCCE